MSCDECLSRVTETDNLTAFGISVADGCGDCSSHGLCWSAGIASDEKRWYDNLKFTRRRLRITSSFGPISLRAIFFRRNDRNTPVRSVPSLIVACADVYLG